MTALAALFFALRFFDEKNNEAREADTGRDEPRLSRCALWGAIWAAVALLAGAVLLAALSDRKPPQSPHESYGILNLPVGFWAFFPISALFGVTTLGGVAVGHIKRSGGKLTGLRLAVAEVLLFPLPVLAGLMAYASGHALAGTQFNAHYDNFVATLTLGVPIVICFFIGLTIWRAIVSRNEIKRSDEVVASEPRLSRCALWGAIWAPFALCGLAVTVPMFPPRDGPVADWIHRHPVGFTVAVGIFTFIGVSAIFGTTILGAIGIAQIKRSGGKLYGLRLAAADALFFPLLVVGALAFWLTNLVAFTIAFNLHTPTLPLPGALPEREPFAVIDFAALDILAALTVMFFAGRAAWRKIADKPADETAAPSSARAKKIALGALAVCVVIAFVVINQHGKAGLIPSA